MKVYIGKYPGNYTIGAFTDWLERIGLPEKFSDKVFDYLDGTWVDRILFNFSRKQKQTIKVKIDKWDTWSMDHTLAVIIVPMLKQLKETKNGAPVVDDEDVPEELKSTSAPPKENDYDLDENWFKRWDWVLDEMIWTFEQKASDGDWTDQYYDHSNVDENADIMEQVKQMIVDKEGLGKHQDRIDNGLRLFGKYYGNLWD
jgi:hypothetical protein